MFEELNKIKGQDSVIAKIKMLVNRAADKNMAIENFIIFSGTEEKRLAIAKAFAIDVEKCIYKNDKSIVDYYCELSNEKNKEREEVLKNKCLFISKYVVAISLKKFDNGADFVGFLSARKEFDIIILNDFEELTDKQIYEYIREAICHKKLTIKLGKGPLARDFTLDLPKITFVFLCEHDDEHLHFIDYSFRLENSLLSDSKDYITDFFKKEGMSITDETVDQIAELKYDLPKLRRKLVELRDNVICQDVNVIDINSLNVFKNQDYSIDYVDNMLDGLEFESFTGDLLKQNGFYDVTVTKSSGDFGVDIIAYKDEIKYAIQCKKYSSPVGIDAVQQVLGSKTMFNCHVGVVLTNNYFTPAALELAEKNNILMWDRNKLINLIEAAK